MKPADAEDSDRLDEAAFCPVPVHADNLAHVIFTPGSTGIPKGAALTHRSLATSALAMCERTAIGPGDRVLLQAPVTLELYLALLAGDARWRRAATAMEAAVAAVAAQVLTRDRLGLDDDVWEAGLHSLLAARLAVAVREVFGVEVDLGSVVGDGARAGAGRGAAAFGVTRRARPSACSTDRWCVTRR